MELRKLSSKSLLMSDDLLRNLDPWKNIFHEFLRRQHVSDARILDA